MKRSDSRYAVAMLIVVLFLFSGIINSPVSARPARPSQSNCPTVKVACPDTVFPGDKLTFTVDLKGGDQQVTPTFNWTVSASSIESGQGTSTIEVNTNDIAGDMTVTATVDVGGFDRSCSTSASCTVSIMKKPEARKLDEFGKIKSEDENSRLDNLLIELQMDPTASGYIITYGGRASRPGDARKAAARAKDYLVKKRGFDPGRIGTMDGGYREQPVTELWIVPSGAQPPQPTPTIERGAPKVTSPTKPKTKTGKKS